MPGINMPGIIIPDCTGIKKLGEGKEKTVTGQSDWLAALCISYRHAGCGLRYGNGIRYESVCRVFWIYAGAWHLHGTGAV